VINFNLVFIFPDRSGGLVFYLYIYKSTADKALESIAVDGMVVKPNTDALGRNTGKTIEVGENKLAEEKISYVKFGDHATNLPSTVRFATNGVFKESLQYRYDSWLFSSTSDGKTVVWTY